MNCKDCMYDEMCKYKDEVNVAIQAVDHIADEAEVIEVSAKCKLF